MIAFDLRLGDVLDVTADALVVPIDGTFVPKEGQFDRLLGNVGRQFLKRFPDAELLEQIEAQVDLPLALGHASAVEVEQAQVKYVVVVSSLHHVGHLDLTAKRALVQTCMRSAFDATVRARATSLASPVLQGGWRLQPDDAFSAMLQAIGAATHDLQLSVHCVDDALHQRLRLLARSLGFT